MTYKASICRLYIFVSITTYSLTTAVVLNDELVRDKNVLPSIGRGYAPSTGTFLSQCLLSDMNHVTTPTYDFSSNLVSIESTANFNQEISSLDKASHNFIGIVSGTVETKVDRSMGTSRESHFLIHHMSFDRYYASADETEMELAPDAIDLLTRQAFFNFFQVCGPGFVRSIRRKGEIGGVISYQSSSSSSSFSFTEEKSDSMNALITSSSSESKVERKETSSSFYESTDIRVAALGLSFRGLDSASIYVKSIIAYKSLILEVMEAMKNPFTGIVDSIEVIPWVNNAQFQANSGILITVETDTYEENSQVRKPMSTMIKKYNLAANAEMLAVIDGIVTDRSMFIDIVSGCLDELASYPSVVLTRKLVNHRGYESSSSISGTGDTIVAQDFHHMTGERLMELLHGQTTTLPATTLIDREYAKLLDYTLGFFLPCMDKLYEDDLGIANGKIMTTHWMSHAECEKIECQIPGALYIGGDCQRQILTVANDYRSLIDAYCLPDFE
uniref:MACPF domain-containing protein n=1 Tax=Corethron hystrix TaxID=216773 RepID=A0A7S1BTC6_9STRA|mmetsp:Transcript_40360/g.94835  ORF Transcript_40360/g.94835 Transcript_40360/m.94835 type:complete len:501 (+) Transcript_40360:661-2163(+)